MRIFTPAGDQGLFDFAIVSTGLLTDARLRPELSAVAQHIKSWRDVALPAGQPRNALIDGHPYLGPSFEFQEQVGCKFEGFFVCLVCLVCSVELAARACCSEILDGTGTVQEPYACV
jgi:hypothetical protein